MWSAACGRLCGLLLAADRPAIDRQIDVCARIADESHHPFYLFWTPTSRVLQALLDGRFAEAERHLADAVSLVPRAHLAHWELWYAPNLFALRREQGRPGDAEQALREAIADDPDPDRDLTYQAMLALVQVETGRRDEARREFEELADGVFAFTQGQDAWSTNLPHGLGYLAAVCVALGDVPRAARLYDLLLPYAGHNLVYGGAWHVAGSASHVLGLLATTLERWNEAVRHFEDALTMNHQLESRPLVAHTQVAYATMLSRRNGDGDREHASALAETARATASDLGMVHLANQATALQATLTAWRASEAVMAIERTGLTERELDVLRLVAAGQSNPQIADALFISRATVRTHVSNILAKLDVRSRAEAVDSAHRRRLLIPDDLPTT
jgi:ATP/maltotriose-dependent transcriptional regulator MalT